MKKVKERLYYAAITLAASSAFWLEAFLHALRIPHWH